MAEFGTGKYMPISKNMVLGGWQWVFGFDNGFGASVVRHSQSYGGPHGLFELAILEFDDDGGWDLTYETQITDDVIGFLSEDDVEEILEKIETL